MILGAFVTGERVERRLAAILAADVEGYSRLMGRDEVSTLRDLTQRRTILDGLIAAHRGRIANTAGDSVLAEFGSAVDAVQCAVEAQAALSEANAALSPDNRINFRIGIHVGDVMVKGGDLFGDGVNIAARLQTLASAGGTCISGAAHDQVRKILPFVFSDLGAQQVKNIEEPVRAFAITMKGASPILSSSNASAPFALPDKPSIAVLPFQNMSGDPEQEYFADGMVEDIITALSRFKSLFVIARNSSFTYKGKAVDIEQVGRELGVRYVLEGSVRKAGGKVRITGQLIDVATGAHVWADKFDGSLDDVFSLQDNVTTNVVSTIYPKIERAEIERSKAKSTENLLAYDYFLRGLSNYYQLSKSASEEAIVSFEKAIELDPNFARAIAWLAGVYTQRKSQGWMIDEQREAAEGARLSRRTIDLAVDDAQLLAGCAINIAYLSGDVDTSITFVDRALQLNPNQGFNWMCSGIIRLYAGETQLAIEHLLHGLQLSPLDPLNATLMCNLAYAHLFQAKYVRAVNWAEKALADRPDFLSALRPLASASALAGDIEKANQTVRRIQNLQPTETIAKILELIPFRKMSDREQLKLGLRLAGLPE